MSKIPWSNVTCSQTSWGQMSLVVKRPAVKCHIRSNVQWSNVTAVKCPAVKCHLLSNALWSNVPRSNVTCGQMSCGQMSAVVKCPIGLLRSNVACGPMSLPPLQSNDHCGLLSCGPMSVVKCPVLKWYCGHRISTRNLYKVPAYGKVNSVEEPWA